jgi:PleD family two-component response regulator
MYMAASPTRTTLGKKQRPRRTSETQPARRALRAVLVAGGRATEARSIARAFEQEAVLVALATTKDEARAQLRGHRWACVMLDARWELELANEAREASETVRCYVTDPKRAAYEGHQPLPLGAADVHEILDDE